MIYYSMSEILHPHVQKLGNWTFKDGNSLEQERIRYIAGNAERRSRFFQDENNQQRWGLQISQEEGLTIATMICAFEFGVRQVYSKVGYSDEEINGLANFRIGIGSLTKPEHKLNSTTSQSRSVVVFGYQYTNTNGVFIADIHNLHTMAQYALSRRGESPITFAEINRRIHIYQYCELTGIEEAAHSLFIVHHYSRSPQLNLVNGPLPPEEHFKLPAEKAALKWKRNYALRFMPDFAQGFVDFENGLADR